MGKIGLYGGTFDPIHYGHLITAQVVLEKRNLDKIVFVPCHISPHKEYLKSTEPTHRLEMLKLAIKGVPYFSFSDYEIQKGEISFTLNTLLEFRKLYDEIELIIGYDNLVVFDKWFKPDEIIKHCELVVMKRSIDYEPKIQHKYFEMVHFVDTPVIDISSSEIRNRIKADLPIRFMVPESVDNYIRTNKLFNEL